MSPLFLGYGADRRPIRLESAERRAHTHVIGSSGSGKSKFLEHLMRQDIKNRQGFCLVDPHGTLYDDVLRFAAARVASRDLILLNPSKPDSIIGFNPFRRVPNGDINVQVDRRVQSIMRAWGVESTDSTPTLARTLRLLFAVMIEHNLGLRQAGLLIDFQAQQVRSALIDQLAGNPFIQREWQELTALKRSEWREEMLSARNRLFKFLSSKTLGRFMSVPGASVDLVAAMDQGKIILVNLAPSDDLSAENAKTFGALLVNEFYECAKRRKRDALGRPPKPYYLYLDEFQNFVSVDIDDMLDQTRKFGLFLVLAHQRFGQLDDNLTDAVLANCRIKAVFGGLPLESARIMAGEMFIGKLDPLKIKVAIKQTKFWPEYRRDKVYNRSSSHGSSSGTAHSSSTASSSGASSTFSSGMSYEGSYFTPDKWFAMQNGFTQSEVSSTGSSWNASSGQSDSYSDSQSWSDSEGEADIPIFFPVPFQELSSVQYFSLEEQMTEMTAALKEQFPRHCFIKLQGRDTEPLLVPLVEDKFVSEANLARYRQEKLAEHGALSPAEADSLIAAQERALLQMVEAPTSLPASPCPTTALGQTATPEILSPPSTKEARSKKPIWNRT